MQCVPWPRWQVSFKTSFSNIFQNLWKISRASVGYTFPRLLCFRNQLCIPRMGSDAGIWRRYCIVRSFCCMAKGRLKRPPGMTILMSIKAYQACECIVTHGRCDLLLKCLTKVRRGPNTGLIRLVHVDGMHLFVLLNSQLIWIVRYTLLYCVVRWIQSGLRET